MCTRSLLTIEVFLKAEKSALQSSTQLNRRFFVVKPCTLLYCYGSDVESLPEWVVDLDIFPTVVKQNIDGDAPLPPPAPSAFLLPRGVCMRACVRACEGVWVWARFKKNRYTPLLFRTFSN